MSLLKDINAVLDTLGIPFETGVFTENAPDKYIVIEPLGDIFAVHADNQPLADVEEARISLFAKGSYTSEKNAIVRAFLGANFTITDRRYIGYETETGYYHYVVDIAKSYEWEET